MKSNRFKLLSLFVIALLLNIACRTTDPPVVVPPAPVNTLAPPEPTAPPATRGLDEPTAEPPPPTAEPTAPPAPTDAPPAEPAAFFDMQFTDRPDQSSANTTFVAPNEVFAIWRYANMRDGDVVRRDWYFNDVLFISREELWDDEAYGADGTRSDVSIFDYENGLEPGSYRVVLLVNDQLALEGAFKIESSAVVQPADPANEPAVTDISFAWSPNDNRRFALFDNASEVFAIIDYENMGDGDVFKRDWYVNGRLFISREESWDTAAYGADGVRTDISIFDYENGLTFGNYRLVVSINGQKQLERRFEVRDAAAGFVQPNILIYGFSETPTEAPGGNQFEAPEELFAILNYNDMAAGDVVQRDWFFNETLFISREETWDMAKYSSQGLRTDISIFDFENGLEFGEYRLLVTVNGVYQGDVSFEVVPLQLIAPLTEPVSGRTAETTDLAVIEVGFPDASTQTFKSNGRVVHLDWFPGGQKLVYASQIVVDPNAYPIFGLSHEVWVIDLATGTAHQLTNLDENMHHPLVSPDGRAIALLRGSGYGDACFVGLDLVILTVDAGGFETGRLTPLNFPLIQADEDEGFSTRTINVDESYMNQTAGLFGMRQVNAGTWQDGRKLVTNIGWNSCTGPFGGVYALDIDTLDAELIEAFEPPDS